MKIRINNRDGSRDEGILVRDVTKLLCSYLESSWRISEAACGWHCAFDSLSQRRASIEGQADC